MIKFDPVLVETLAERITDDPRAQSHINEYAYQCITHLEQHIGPVTDPRVREELVCQYQAQAWKALFIQILNL